MCEKRCKKGIGRALVGMACHRQAPRRMFCPLLDRLMVVV